MERIFTRPPSQYKIWHVSGDRYLPILDREHYNNEEKAQLIKLRKERAAKIMENRIVEGRKIMKREKRAAVIDVLEETIENYKEEQLAKSPAKAGHAGDRAPIPAKRGLDGKQKELEEQIKSGKELFPDIHADEILGEIKEQERQEQKQDIKTMFTNEYPAGKVEGWSVNDEKTKGKRRSKRLVRFSPIKSKKTKKKK